MDLLIKCSGECRTLDQCPPVAAFAFTVRHAYRMVHREGGVVCRGKPASVPRAKTEAVRRALAWLLNQPAAGRAVIRSDWPEVVAAPAASVPPGQEDEQGEVRRMLCRLREQGWAVEMQPAAPEYVSEAYALSCRTALWAIREWTRQKAISAESARKQAAGSPSPVMVRRVSRKTWPPGVEADIVITCDGGYKPLSDGAGIAAYACLVRRRSRLTHKESGVVCWGPAARSQVAELGAVVAALRWLIASPLAVGTRVEIRSDCQWVVDNLAGQCSGRVLRGTVMLLRTVDRLLCRLHQNGCQVAIWRTPRKLVAEADALCRQVYAERLARNSTGLRRQPLKAFLRGRNDSPA
ncbi:MAG TPA: ribonuclease H family protein [Symbiobacteriaceae bacterium]